MKLVAVSDSYITTKTIDELLTPQEQILFRNFKKERQQQWLLGRIALKSSYSINNLSKIAVEYNNLEQPVIKNNRHKGFCSIAHSGTMALGLFAQLRIGVDIEEMRSHHPALLDYISSEDEKEIMHEPISDLLVTKLWVLKESVAKAVGRGLQTPLNAMHVVGRHGEMYIINDESTMWEGSILTVGNYILAVVAEEKRKKQQLEFIHLQ